MACFSPNFIVSVPTDNKFWPPKHEGFKVTKDGKKFYKFITSKQYQFDKSPEFWKKELIEGYQVDSVPCGCCIGCRVDYSKQWAARCLLEAEQYKDNYFVTLTYDDKHLPKGQFENSSLNPDDFTKFMKDLRAYYKNKFGHDGIRFFGCGEYGDVSMRPHLSTSCYSIYRFLI